MAGLAELMVGCDNINVFNENNTWKNIPLEYNMVAIHVEEDRRRNIHMFI
jgi:hypothetical protein